MTGTLFDVSRTTTERCLVCGAERAPDEEKARACEVDYRRRNAEQYGGFTSRPAACLNTPRPEHTDIPY